MPQGQVSDGGAVQTGDFQAVIHGETDCRSGRVEQPGKA
jgi:hypothetical protein